VRGESLDVRTDIFSFGLVLYEMATGERAFTGETEADVSHAIVNETPSPAHKANPGISPELSGLIDKALEKEREHRYQSIADLVSDLERVAATPSRPARLKWKLYTAAAVLIAIASAGFLYLALSTDHTSHGQRHHNHRWFPESYRRRPDG